LATTGVLAEGGEHTFASRAGFRSRRPGAAATWKPRVIGRREWCLLNLVQPVHSAQEIADAARRIREVGRRRALAPQTVLEVFERWAEALAAAELREIPGVSFLRLWLRRGTLERVLRRELGPDYLQGGWCQDGPARLRAFPLGVVGHWPAGNIEIQPLLSMTCALLGGNGCLVRVPTDLVESTQLIMKKLEHVEHHGVLAERIFMMSFDHSRLDLHEAMAKAVDGAMIWGGAEAVTRVRSLGFPHWARVMVYGPRLSVAMMDRGAWSDPIERRSWCRRLARDVWQFEQGACSSPVALFLERRAGSDAGEFVKDLRQAFEDENRAHPRRQIDVALTSAICHARASWLLDDVANRALFPSSPDWTILLGTGVEIPTPTRGRTLYVLLADDLREVISRFDGTVQTLGLGISDARREETLAQAAGSRGVDRIVPLGRMHVFGSPWDGADLVRLVVRLVRHVPAKSSRPAEEVRPVESEDLVG